MAGQIGVPASSLNGFQGFTPYNNDRPPSTGSGEADIASDPASSSFFVADYKKHEDLKVMLDSNKDSLKLEAMKRIIGMVAKGKDASDLFPAVVKNVVSKNIEVKKLVYVYLVRYAEEQQDLALLSIATFQRALKDPNQLIRASALRVLSSIRVPMIVPIMMLAIKEAVMDMSPYVRKTAAHAIPKLYCLDPEQKNILIEVIEKLLADKTTLVAGSAIQAFEEVCPDRIDLIHKNYRKLCNLLVDVEEWGQVVIINMLTRYCRGQFLDPNSSEFVEEDPKNFYESSGESHVSEETNELEKKKPYSMDGDHRLLLRTCKPLLNSRNASVVMAVAQLYHHCAPRSEVSLVIKALIRLLRGHKEVQYVVLSNIATMSVKHKGMFEPYLKSFYVRSNDPTQSKLLKLEILTTLATETNISTILREFQTYVTSSDKEFAAATIQAIGRCASNISEVTDTCLNGLVSLLSNRDEVVVGESVVVIKKLLQMRPSEHKDIITHLAKIIDNISVPMAKASILWLIGEYSHRVPLIAPDVLRKMAKTFINEDDIVKLQILTLAAKLYLTNPKQTKLLCQYVLNLAKYDQNYDIRDRARFLRALIMPSGEKTSALAKNAKKIFLASKPAPVSMKHYHEQDHYQLGTLSHLIHNKAQGYQELPDWPAEAPDPSVRNVEVYMPWTAEQKAGKSKRNEKKKKSFYSDSESSVEGSSSSGSGSESDSGSEEESSSYESSSTAPSSSESESESESESDDSEKESIKPSKLMNGPREVISKADVDDSGSEDEDSSSSESSSSSEESDESSEDEAPPPPKPLKKSQRTPAPVNKDKKAKDKKKTAKQEAVKRPTDMLLDLDFDVGAPAGPTMQPMNMLSPLSSSSTPAARPQSPAANYNIINPVQTEQVQEELLNRITGQGLSAMYAFTRTVSIFSPKMVSIDLQLTNHSDKPLSNVKMTTSKTPVGMEIQEFPPIESLAPGQTSNVLMGVNFNDTTQPATFNLCHNAASIPVSISSPVGELLQPNTLTENNFLQIRSKLTGMTEATGSVDVEDTSLESLCQHIYTIANVLQVASSKENELYFAGKTVAGGVDVLVTLSTQIGQKKVKITVNCEKMVIGNVLVKDIKAELKD